MPEQGKRLFIIPQGDDKPRSVCSDCGHIEYGNPKTACFVVATYQNKILLCKRAIPPSQGYWTLPGGHQEQGESKKQAAIREAFEEATAKVAIDAMLSEYELLHAGITLTIYRAELTDPEVKAASETYEAKLFEWDEIPWNDLAFPMVEKALRFWQKTRNLTDFAPEQEILPPAPQRPSVQP